MIQARILVVGGGVAGASCALRLRQHGLRVVVAEKAEFPRTKVCGCCLGGAGLAALAQLSLKHWVEENGVHTKFWRGSIGGKRIELALPDGVAISRRSLDSKMLATAALQGADVLTPCRATIDRASKDSVAVTLQMPNSDCQHEEFAAVVVASGLNADGLKTDRTQPILPWKEQPHGPFGISFTATCRAIESGVIFMACDDDGYVGLVRLEDDRVDIAAALRSGSNRGVKRSPKARIEAILARSEFDPWKFDDCSPALTTPPLRRTRTAGSGCVLAIGDAAGYVEPFTGEGMTWAMESGIAAADLIAKSSDALPQLGAAWDRDLALLLRRKKRTCRAVTSALRWPIARFAAGRTLAHWPGIARPLIRSLN